MRAQSLFILTHATRQAPMNDEPRYPAGSVIFKQSAKIFFSEAELDDTAGIPPLILVDPPSCGSSVIFSTVAHVKTYPMND